MSRLSHLGYIALAVIDRDPGSTGYAVMKAFQGSTSSYFSGSAGAIYPLLKRLEEQGLVLAKESKAGSRTRKNYSITTKGKKELKVWLSAPVPSEDIAFTVDLLRTRALFFRSLTKPQQRAFVKDVRAQVKARVKNRLEHLRANKDADKFDKLAARSSIILEQARLKWLDELERAIEE